MSNYNTLKTTINANIKQNGNQEITGQILNSVLNQMVNILGTGYQFAGVATRETNPGTPDAKIFYIANGKGTYEKFGGLEVTEDEVVVLYWDSAWHKVATGIASQAKLSELKEKVDALSLGAFYGYFPDSASLPTDITTLGYAYVGLDNPYKIWNFNGESWSDSGTSIDMNDADEEDITRNADGKLQFKGRPYGDGMGYVILRKDKTFAEQVTQVNTIYEIRYDFNLGGGEVEIPSGCVLKFVGGSINGGVIICNNTLLSGNVILYQVKGTIANKVVYASWFTHSDYSNISVCVFNSDAVLFVDKDISMDGTLKDVLNVRIDGDHAIKSPCRYKIHGNVVSINNVSIEDCFDGEFLSPDSISELTLKINNINFDGSNKCTRFFNWFDTSISTILHLDINRSSFVNVLNVIVNHGGDSDGRIANCRFKDIGSLTDATNILQCPIRLGRNYQGDGIARDVEIIMNSFLNIKSPYLTGEDAKETHAIIVYGVNCTIDGNYIENIYSSRDDSDAGAETEGIYVKGNFNKITNNVLINAVGGTNSDGAITIKGLLNPVAGKTNYGNIISNNQIIMTRGYGFGIVSYCDQTLISGNTLNLGDSRSIAVEFLVADNTLVEGNTILVNGNGTSNSYSTAFYVASPCKNIRFKSNYIECSTLLTFSLVNDNPSHFLFEDNEIKVKDVQYGTTSRYSSFINAMSTDQSTKLIFKNNRFELDSVRCTAFFRYLNDLTLENNLIEFIKNDSSPITFIMNGFVGNCKRVMLKDNIIKGENLSAFSLYFSMDNSELCSTLRNVFVGDTQFELVGVAIDNVIASEKHVGTTEERQAVKLIYGAKMEGYQFFDTTLNKPCFAKSINYSTHLVTWVDATGTEV